MKKSKAISLFLAVMAIAFFSHSLSFAQEKNTGAHPEEGTTHPFFLEIGAKYFYTDYKEEINPPGKSTNSDWLPGVHLGIGYRKIDGFYAGLYGSYASGDLTYDGSDQMGTKIYFSNDPQTFYRFEANIGYAFKTGKKTFLVPFMGYGYRYWKRGEANVPLGNYKEEYDWHYLPLGIKVEHGLNEQWRIGVTAAAHFMFMGRLKVSLSELDPGYNNPGLHLGDKIGLYGAIPISCKLTENWSVIGTPWYEYRPIGESDLQILTYYGTAISLLREPASTTHQYGFDLTAAYAF